MISVNGQILQNVPIQLSIRQQVIFNALQKSENVHRYESINLLAFELMLREKIIEASLKLYESNIIFAPFKISKFNPAFWIKTPSGYRLRPNVRPSDAIRDIFANSHMYAFECSTAIVIIYYYAVLQVINEQAFNQLFSQLLVWNWSYDEDLRIITRVGTDFIPGDVLYFHNPDYADPVWLGENVVMLDDHTYFGHGIGVGPAEYMIQGLNTLRKPNATRSAYLLSQYSRLDFRYLAQFSNM